MKNQRKWFSAATLVCLALLTIEHAAFADATVTSHPVFHSVPHFLAIPGILALVTGLLMASATSFRRRTANEQNGRKENGEGNGHSRPEASRMEAIGTSERFYQEIVENVNDLIYTLDLRGRFTSLNAAARCALGYTVEEVPGLTTDKIVAPECWGLVRHMREAKLATGEATTREITVITKDGRRILLEVSSRLITANGQPTGIVGVGRDITERRRAEINSRETGTDLLDVLLENSEDMIYFKDSQSRFVRYSKAFVDRFGGNGSEGLKGKTDFDLFHEDHARVAYADEQQIMRTGQPIIGKLEHETYNDGRTMWALTTKMPWRDKDGNVVGTFGISKNVTALKEVEDKLARERELLRTLLDNVPEHIYFKDRESRFVYVSKSKVQKTLRHVPDLGLRRSHGMGPGTSSDTDLLVGLTDFDMFTEEHARRAFEDEQEIIRTGIPVIGKVERETHHDGGVTWSLSSKVPWRDKDGNIIGTFGISKDITAIKEAEKKLADERERFQSLLDTLPDNIYFKDLESRFVSVSRSKVKKSLEPARRLYFAKNTDADSKELPIHLKSEEEFARYLIGRTDYDTYEEEFAHKAFEEEREIIRTGKPIIGKLECIPAQDDSCYWMLVTKMPWCDKDGRIIGTFGLSRDITALKQAQAELETTHNHLVRASRMAGMAEVATDVLHNVGNVLNSVNVSCSLVIDRVQETCCTNLAKIPELLRENFGRLDEFLTTDEKGKHLLEYLASLAQTFEEQKTFLLRELNQLRNHVEHIKQVVTMQQNYAKVAGVEETIDVTHLVEDALRMNADALTRHAVTYRRKFEPVPPLHVDKHKVLQILVNLIRNAKYAVTDSPRRDKEMTICIRPHGEDRVQIQVADNGVGIAPENLTRIFAHGFTTRKGGHGFGLHSGALAARDLGGSLAAHSDGLGKGATFTLELPLKYKKPGT
jgi:PAS domain S-box-containing protein